MDKVNNGGPAFPIVTADDIWKEGATLRDYFAAKALTGMVSDSENSFSIQAGETHWTQAVARVAYQLADEMIKARA